MTITTTIPSGSALSPAIDVRNTGDKDMIRLFGIAMPAAWTAASLTFQASVDGGATWINVMDKTGAEYVVTAGTSRYIPLDPTPFSAITYIKIRSGTSGVPVNQGADAVITLVLRS